MPERETVLVVGSGAREQVIAEELAKDPTVDKVFIAPGNAGTQFLNRLPSQTVENIELPHGDAADIVDIAKQRNVSMVVVGPEAWLGKELGDILKQEKIPAIAPEKKAAMLELDKVFTRINCRKWGVPQPKFASFTDEEQARQFVVYNSLDEGVIKVAGEALGKGVKVCDTREQMFEAINTAKEKFGSAAEKILVEEKLYGTEVSYIVLTDGNTFLPLAPAMDYKRLEDGDAGPNTGGMGSIAPNPYVGQEVALEIEDKIIRPIIEGMREDQVPYVGVLYAGVMLTKDGPKLLEINARHGDPETQVQLQLLKHGLFDLYKHVINKTLNEVVNPNYLSTQKAAATVVLAARGYPESPQKGDTITGLRRNNGQTGLVYLAGAKESNGQVFTNGGRVASVVGIAKNLEEAVNRAYELADKINFPGKYNRVDIGGGRKNG